MPMSPDLKRKLEELASEFKKSKTLLKSKLEEFKDLLKKHENDYNKDELLVNFADLLEQKLKNIAELSINDILILESRFRFFQKELKQYGIPELNNAVEEINELFQLLAESRKAAQALLIKIGFLHPEQRSKFKEDEKEKFESKAVESVPQVSSVDASTTLEEAIRKDISLKLKKFKEKLDAFLNRRTLYNDVLKEFNESLNKIHFRFFPVPVTEAVGEFSLNDIKKFWDEYKKISQIILGIEGGKCYQGRYLDLRFEAIKVNSALFALGVPFLKTELVDIPRQRL